MRRGRLENEFAIGDDPLSSCFAWSPFILAAILAVLYWGDCFLMLEELQSPVLLLDSMGELPPDPVLYHDASCLRCSGGRSGRIHARRLEGDDHSIVRGLRVERGRHGHDQC